MKNRDYMELINGYKAPLSRKDAILQIIYLIEKESYESANLIIESYGIKRGELSFFRLKESNFSKFINYLKNRKY